VRCRHLALGPPQTTQARGHAGDGVTRLGRRDARRIEYHILGGGATPAMHMRALAPAFADGIVAVHQELQPAAVQLGQTVSPTGGRCPAHRYAMAHGRDGLFAVGADSGSGGGRAVCPAISGLLMTRAAAWGFVRRFQAVTCL
jgi:hypothetical protein